MRIVNVSKSVTYLHTYMLTYLSYFLKNVSLRRIYPQNIYYVALGDGESKEYCFKLVKPMPKRFDVTIKSLGSAATIYFNNFANEFDNHFLKMSSFDIFSMAWQIIMPMIKFFCFFLIQII